jgi:hypothetical protein
MQTLLSISRNFNNKKIKKIVNVYQLKYKNGVAQGLGDYIRGCFSMLQVSALLGLSFDMDISNHPMSKFLLLPEDFDKTDIKYEEVYMFKNSNYIPINSKSYIKNSYNFFNELVNHLNTSYSESSETAFLFCNSFPMFNVQDIGCKFIRSRLCPNELMQKNIKYALDRLELIPKRFAVIHIRSGDKYLLKDGALNSVVVKKIVNILSKNMKPATKYLLISDNNKIKILLKNIFPQITIQISKIAHLGESINPSDDSIMETLLDFYLMSNAFQIISFSPYNWGSGFSQWCSILYKIPYTQIQVLDKLS